MAPEVLYGRISDFEHAPLWREGLSQVVRLEYRDGKPVYEELSPQGSLRYKVVELAAPSRVVTEIVDSSDFGGRWTFQIEPTARGSRLTIREDGFVPNPVFRFFAR